MNKITAILLACIFSITFYSCKTSKEATTKVKGAKKNQEVFIALQDNAVEFDAVSLKSNISIVNNKKKISFRSSIRMKKDSAIWSSITFLGIAGAKALITVDSIKTVNYKDKNYVSESNEGLNELFKTKLMSLENLQALLTGNLINLGSFEKYYIKKEGEYIVLSTLSDRKSEKDWIEKKLQKMEKRIEKQEEKQNEKGQERIEKKYERRPDKFAGVDANIWVDTSIAKVRRMEIKDYMSGGTMKVEYDNYKETDLGLFPFNCKVSLETEKVIEFNIVYSKVSVEEELKMPFSVPKKYERIEL